MEGVGRATQDQPQPPQRPQRMGQKVVEKPNPTVQWELCFDSSKTRAIGLYKAISRLLEEFDVVARSNSVSKWACFVLASASIAGMDFVRQRETVEELFEDGTASLSCDILDLGAYFMNWCLGGWGPFPLGFSNITDPKSGWCRRKNGKKWRCNRNAVANHKYYKRHINKVRHHSRKPVEGHTGHSVSGADTSIINTSTTKLTAVSSSHQPWLCLGATHPTVPILCPVAVNKKHFPCFSKQLLPN
ncbi:hypothetical protein Nepgr_023851 [Nepenthes gracilis]|uniref:Growth-regulating factor n=1 Tax=Nepenthes gracilis TaxID=150966 RepID=A0AAD3T1Q3_NEPGR|nr:hypothetical protein Nepgr_023851 [Nepenthes gracilis]